MLDIAAQAAVLSDEHFASSMHFFNNRIFGHFGFLRMIWLIATLGMLSGETIDGT